MNTKKNSIKKGFTLVELIIVIAIIAILAVTAFLLLTKWLSKARDSSRASNLANIEKSLQISLTDKSSLPKPDSYTLIYASGTSNVIGYQGYFGDGVKDAVGNINSAPKDGDDYFTYYLNADLNKYQLASFMENTTAYNKNVVNAVDYSARFVTVKGDKLGLLTDLNKSPLQTLGLTGLDISTGNVVYVAYMDNNTTVSGTGKVLAGLAYRSNLTNIKNGLLAHYSFDSISGTGLNDSSGNGNVGNISGAVQTGGISGKGIYFNGNSIILFKNFSPIKERNEYTRAGWVYGWNLVSGQRFYTEGEPGVSYLLCGNAGNLALGSYNDFTSAKRKWSYFTSSNFNANGWNFLTIIGKNLDIDSGTVDYYINGQKIGTYNSQKAFHNIGLQYKYTGLGGNVGAFFGGGQTPQYYTGSMDEVRIYDHALSENEVKALYYRPSN